MFSVLDDAIPLNVLQGDDPVLGLARHVGLRPRGWETAAYALEPRSGLDRLGRALAERLATRPDLRFFKLDVIWSSKETPARVADLRERTGLDASAILRLPVVAAGAGLEDWAALFGFALGFSWDAAVVSRGAGALLWFSHDEVLQATPPSLVRGL